MELKKMSGSKLKKRRSSFSLYYKLKKKSKIHNPFEVIKSSLNSPEEHFHTVSSQ